MSDADTNEAPKPPQSTREVSSALAVFLGWLGVALTNALYIAIAVPRPPSGVRVRLLHHLYDAGYIFALGCLSTLLVLAWLRVRPRFAKKALVSVVLIAGISLAVGSLVLVTDLDNLASRLALRFHKAGMWPTVILNVLVFTTAMGVVISWLVGRSLARPYFRWLGVVIGLGFAVTNQLILNNDYEGAHFYLAWAAATLIGASLDGAPLPASRFAGALPRRIAFGVATAWAIAAVATRPSTNVLLQLYTTSGSALAPLLAHLRGRAIPAQLSAGVFEDQAPWFTSRARLADVPPSESLFAGAPVVIFLGIDSVRADVLADPHYLAQVPELAKLKATGVYFSQARSPGPGTVFTYSALFSDRYFSQMYWSEKSGGIWPWQDQSTRFPELLDKHGVTTADIASILWFTNDWGVARGFTEETNMDARASASHSTAPELVNALIARLDKQGPEPLFLFTHFMDAHFPYDQGSRIGPPKDRFVSELAIVDRQIARLREAIAKMPLASRTMLIVTADHGEAFGEHHTYQHGTTLYEELLRVPLIFSAPNLTPRDVTEPVSLIDIAPTVLDLFGAPTPGVYMGQSLVPFLRGETPKLTRPIIAEGRLKRSLVFRDGFKVITDERRGTVELYNLTTDPGELKNLALDGSAEAEPRVGTIDAFFQAQSLDRPGYKPPYRP